MIERNQCGHCNGGGTCKSNAGNSCAVCIQKYKLISEESPCGLPCSVCKGVGSLEPTSLKFHNRFVPILALAFVGLAFVTIFVFGLYSNHLDKILPFAGTLIGSITGYYFAGRGEAMGGNDSASAVNDQQTPPAPTPPVAHS